MFLNCGVLLRTLQKVELLDLNTIIFHFGPMDNVVILHFSLPEVAIRHLYHDITHVAPHFSHYDYLGKGSEAGPDSSQIYITSPLPWKYHPYSFCPTIFLSRSISYWHEGVKYPVDRYISVTTFELWLSCHCDYL